MDQKYIEIKVPKDFAELNDKSHSSITFGIANLEECKFLAGTISDKVRVPLEEAYIFKIVVVGGVQQSGYYLVGSENGEYRSSSLIKLIDFDKSKIRTFSGNVYGFDYLSAEEPNHLMWGLCGTFTHWGLSKLTKTPIVYLS